MSDQNPVFIPGPTNIPERLRRAMSMPTLDHRSPAFAATLASVLADLRRVFQTSDAHIITFPATGTGGWEAALANTLSPGDTVLAARAGMFSAKWIAMAEALGLTVEVLETPWGEAMDPARVEAALSADREGRVKAVLVTHNETSTGVTADIAAIRAAMNAAGHDALLFVDGVSSIASIDFRMDEWGVDVALTGSQKGFMLHAGLSIVAVSEKAWAAMPRAGLPRFFFDFAGMEAATAAGNYPYTPNAPLIFGLRESLTMLLEEEGLPAVFARHRRLAEGVRAAVAAWGLPLQAARPAHFSDTVSAIRVPEGFDADALVAHARDTHGVTFGGGLGQLAGQVFRIGHLGSLTPPMALSGLATIEMAMADLGYPITLGSGVAAAQAHYRATTPNTLKEAA
jgi:alanine-glyoxylate transaminase/serine-glyoxylate transaminase/serine-pyruvate transaminase